MDFLSNHTGNSLRVENILSAIWQSPINPSTTYAPSTQNNISTEQTLENANMAIWSCSDNHSLNRENYLKEKIIQLIETDNFFCEYQPIICTQTQEIYGYEALARFKIDNQLIRPNVVFNALHKDLPMLFLLESAVKKFQIKHRPKNARLFLNLDPDSCDTKNHFQYWKAIFEKADNLVVEITENTSISNLDKVKALMQHLQKSNISIALDDFGASDRLFCFDLLERTNYLKLDLHWFECLARSAPHKLLLIGLIEFAKAKNIKCVFEGIETPEKLKLAEELGVEYVQGFLFRQHFIQINAGH